MRRNVVTIQSRLTASYSIVKQQSVLLWKSQVSLISSLFYQKLVLSTITWKELLYPQSKTQTAMFLIDGGP